jgi:ABC-type sugar transport system, periplasmic component
MKTRKTTALLLIAVMITLLLSACGKSAAPTSTATTTAKSQTGTTVATTEDPIQPVTLTVYGFTTTGSVDGIQTDAVAEHIKEKTGVTINLIAVKDDAKYTAMVASGDLPDVLEVTPTSSQTAPSLVKDLINAKLLMPLDELLNKYGKDIIANAGSMVDFCRKNYSVDGKLYDLQAVINPGSATDASKGVTLRFDYYAELGYPTINSTDDWLNAISKMLKAHPKTDSGEVRYGFSPFFEWGLSELLTYGEEIQELGDNITTTNYGQFMTYNCKTKDVSSYILDNNSPMWAGAEFLYKANKMGLLDPDMFTNTWDTVNTKSTADRVLSCSWTWTYDTINQKLAPDGKGYAIIKPAKETGYYWGTDQTLGYSPRLWTIPAKSSNPEAAMRFINYMYSYEGARTIASGVIGTDYVETSDGKLIVPKNVISAEQSDANYKFTRGIGKYAGMAGLGDNVVDPKYNQMLGLKKDSDKEVLPVLNPFQKLYCEHYGIDRPSHLYDNFTAYWLNGSVISLLDVAPDNIQEINTAINAYLATAVENLIIAKDDAAFEAGKQKIIQTCKEKGIEQSFEWWKQNWKNAMEKAGVN